MKLHLTLLLGAIGVAGAARAELPNQPVERIELDRYLGTWHEVARLPNRYQDDCISGTTATYLRGEDGEIVVRNACTADDGERLSVDGVAREVVSGSGNLQVRFAPRWLEPQLDPVVFDGIKTRAAARGYAVERLWVADTLRTDTTTRVADRR